MFQSYFKIGWRNLLRNKGYSFINIGGLAIGMAVVILNGLWIYDEFSFDRYHENYDRIGQIVKGQTREGEYSVGQTMTYPLGTELKTKYSSNFKRIVRTSWIGDYIISSGEKKMSVKGQFADADIPAMLSLKMICGNWSSALDKTHSVIISSSTASALFGNSDPCNKVITLNNKTQMNVSGVFEDLPLNTSFYGIQFFSTWDLFLITNPWIEERAVNDWRNHFIKIYAEILPGSDFKAISENIKDAELNNLSAYKDELARNPQVFLHPMSKWHLHPYGRRGDIDYEPLRMVRLVGTIGVFVLILACINFMNLSTARSEKRAKEVGIRKTIGSGRSQLISQFFSESYLVVIIAFAVSVIIVNLSLPWFNDLTSKQITMPWLNSGFWFMASGFILVTGLLSGSYPAFFLSSFSPIKVLKGTFRAGRFSTLPRKVLVVLQFTISAILIICTIIVYQQIQFAKNRPVGYDSDGLIMMQMKSDDFHGKYDVLRNELKNTGAVKEMSASMGPVTDVYSGNDGFEWNGKALSDDSFGTLAVTHEHGKTIGWQFVSGRDFSRELPSDSMGMVINESAAKFFGSQDPVGESVAWKWWKNDKPPLHYTILGVIKDMVMESPYKAVEPTVFYIQGHNGTVSWLNIKINPDVNASEALAKIENVFKRIVPSVPFDYKFADEEYALKFASEERIGKLASVFGGLAILISCLGLFGLASFVAEQRTKEIGIRKVLGASVLKLWKMLSKDFVVLVVIACFIAIPITNYFLSSWLEKFEYRIQISWWVFGFTSMGALFITLLTVSFQSIKAALMNPAKSLKSE